MRLSFRTIMIGVLITFLVGTVSVVAIASYLSARASAQTLSTQIMDQVARRTDGEIRAVLDVAVAQSQYHARLLASGKLDPTDCRRLAGFFREAMTVNKRLSYLSLGRERDGSYCHVARGPDGKLTVRMLVREPDGRLSLTDFEPRGDELVQQFHEANKPENDPRKRPYYQAAVARGRPTWTESYVFIGQSGALDIPGVTYATPIVGSDGTRIGVMTADFDLLALSDFLAKLRVVARGFAFVVELRKDGSRRVIAHPEPKLLTRPSPGGGADTVDAAQIADPRAQALAARATTAGTEASYLQFDVAGVPYVGSIHPLAADDDVQWLICVAVPEDDILGEVKANTRLQIVIGVGSVLVAMLLAMFVGALIAQPLRALAREAVDIGQFRLDARGPKQGRVTEVHQLALAVEDMKASLRSFRKFVPAELVRSLLASGQEAKLGGKRQMLTVYFSDLEGFTGVSEQLAPEVLVELLSEYLAAMTKQILEEGGTVDKYIGDAIMAFWGAPMPNDDHAFVACRTALRNQQRLVELRADWERRGLPAFNVRIGLNTGEAIVGNIGSEERLDYTAIGDSVNLASRLEGLNKYFSTRIIISASTYAAVRGRVVARPLDLVSVKGKAKGAMVYELLALRDGADPALVELVDVHTAAVEAYLAQDWDRAIANLERVLAMRPDDPPAKNLRERCEKLRVEPPGPDWDGIYRMYRK